MAMDKYHRYGLYMGYDMEHKYGKRVGLRFSGRTFDEAAKSRVHSYQHNPSAKRSNVLGTEFAKLPYKGS